MNDPMRRLAWTLVGLGLAIPILGLVIVPARQASLREAARLSAWGGPTETALLQTADGLSVVPWLIGGAIVAAFGILLLAIRRPLPATPLDEAAPPAAREPSINDLTARAIERLRPPQSKS